MLRSHTAKKKNPSVHHHTRHRTGGSLLSVKKIVLGLILLGGLLASVVLLQRGQDIRNQAVEPSVAVSCGAISISPKKDVYKPGEKITINVKGLGPVSDIKVNWLPSDRNITQVPYISQSIAGTYLPENKTWSGTWTLPNENREYMLVVNTFQSNGLLCSGNPGYQCANCKTGTKAGTGVTAGQYGCQGCHQKIVVNGDHGRSTGFDLKQYWQLNPGNSWLFEGTSKVCGKHPELSYCSSPKAFQLRVAVEAKTMVCGHPLLPVRFNKSIPEGYILENRPLNFRKFMTYYQPGERWSEDTVGKVLNKYYNFVVNDSNAATLGNLGSEVFTGSLGGFRHLDETSADFTFNYFAPHFFTPRYASSGWHFDNVELLYGAGITKPSDWNACDWYYNKKNLSDANAIERYMSNDLYYQESITTPAYSGPALRLTLIEARYPIGSGWHLREDWYFAEGKGRVKLDAKLLRDINHGGANGPNLCVNTPNPDPDCDPSHPMVNPDVTLSLKNYYVGGPLQVTTAKSLLSKTDTNTLYVVSKNTGAKYTGYLEAKTCISETPCTPGAPFKWGYGNGTYLWVQDGVATYDVSKVVSSPSGLRHSYFRPWIERTPAGATAETLVTPLPELPWSNEVNIRIQ